MPKIQYQHFNFRAATLATIDRANEIIEEYQAQGFSLTLRQLYYQFVARGMIANRQSEYKRLGSVINDARLAGLIDWDAIEDRTRELEILPRWASPQQILEAVANQYHRDHWVGQEHRPEVWIEKEALSGVIEGICNQYDVPFFACRGYVSQSEQWRAGVRYSQIRKNGQKPIVLHFGDHDPSGIDMTRDNADRLTMFSRFGVEVRRLALNFDQVEEYGPPPNPAKVTDSRYESYAAEHGDESWELDALEPQVISDLIQEELFGMIDQEVWQGVSEREDREKQSLEQVQDRWDEVLEFLEEE